MREIKISEREAGQRLDKFLAKYMELAPKSFFYKMLRKKNIVLNDKKAQGGERLENGDTVTLFLSEETIEKFRKSAERLLPVNPSSSAGSVPFSILYEDRDVLLLNKPCGVLTQKAKSEDVSLNEAMIDWLLATGKLSKEQLRLQRPSVCSRLDRNTSGIVTAGITLQGLQGLSEILRDRTLDKRYYALVRGNMEGEQLLKGYLLKAEDNRATVLERPEPGSKYMEAEYRSLAASGDFTFLEIHLITGRSHQIRAQLSAVGHPVAGDPKYGNPDVEKQFRIKFGLKGQLLHAGSLKMPENCPLENLAGKKFTAPLTHEFQNVLDKMNISCPEELTAADFNKIRQEIPRL